jgi:hypothetical protein
VNREKTNKLIKALSTFIQSGEGIGEVQGFDMLLFIQPLGESPRCGTAGCLAGWAYAVIHAGSLNAAFVPTLYGGYWRTEQIQREATEFLGLTKEQAKSLFLPEVGVPDITSPWFGVEKPILLKEREGAILGIKALERALEMWSVEEEEDVLPI